MLLKHSDLAGQGPVSERGTQLNAYETNFHGNVDSTNYSDDHAMSISDRVSQSAAVGTVSTNVATNENADTQQATVKQQNGAPQIPSLDVKNPTSSTLIWERF